MIRKISLYGGSIKMKVLILLSILIHISLGEDYVHSPIQYQSQTDRGTYNFGYDTGLFGAHQFHQEYKDDDGVVRGRYGYTDPYGKLRLVHYKSGPGGYEAWGDTGADQPEDKAAPISNIIEKTVVPVVARKAVAKVIVPQEPIVQQVVEQVVEPVVQKVIVPQEPIVQQVVEPVVVKAPPPPVLVRAPPPPVLVKAPPPVVQKVIEPVVQQVVEPVVVPKIPPPVLVKAPPPVVVKAPPTPVLVKAPPPPVVVKAPLPIVQEPVVQQVVEPVVVKAPPPPVVVKAPPPVLVKAPPPVVVKAPPTPVLVKAPPPPVVVKVPPPPPVVAKVITPVHHHHDDHHHHHPRSEQVKTYIAGIDYGQPVITEPHVAPVPVPVATLTRAKSFLSPIERFRTNVIRPSRRYYRSATPDGYKPEFKPRGRLY